MKRLLVTCLLLALGPACDGSDGKKSTTPGINTGTTTGISAGTGTGTGAGTFVDKGFVGNTLSGPNACGTASTTLTRKVPLTLGQVPSDLEVGPAWVSHSKESYVDYFYGAIKVTNKGAVGHCFVKATSISFLGEAGQPVGNDPLTYVYGRVKVVTSSVSTQTCLDPGESGYFNIIEKLNYFDVASIHVEGFDYDDRGKAPLANLQSTSYTVTGKSLSIPTENVGTGSANDIQMLVYALDAAGEFEHWAFGSFSNRELWAPGEKRTGTANLAYEAPCPKILALPYFRAAEESSSSLTNQQFLSSARDPADPNALTAALHHQRNQTEESNLARLRR